MLRVVVDKSSGAKLAAGLDELARERARRMLAMALEAKIKACIAAFADQREDGGRRLVVRNGHARPRQVTTMAGAIEVQAPRWMTGVWSKPRVSGACCARRFCRCGVGVRRR
jgi:putative transposase